MEVETARSGGEAKQNGGERKLEVGPAPAKEGEAKQNRERPLQAKESGEGGERR